MIKGVLLDIAGVLSQSGQGIAGAADAVSELRSHGLPIRFLTNSTRRPKRKILEQIGSIGIPARPEEVLTPAAAARDWLIANTFRPHLLVHPDLEEDFADCPKSAPPAVVVGDAGRFFTFERLNAAFRQIEAGAPFLALAANRVFKDQDGQLSLDAGAFIRALEYSSGRQAHLFGKPAETFFLAGIHSMGCLPRNVVMVGDDAESDVAGAIDAGVSQGILVQTGKYRSGDENRFQPAPTAVARDIREAVEIILTGR